MIVRLRFRSKKEVLIRKISKYVLLYAATPAVLAYGARIYVLDYAISSFKFGCDTAALKTERFYSPEIGKQLFNFCTIYTDNIKKEFGR